MPYALAWPTRLRFEAGLLPSEDCQDLDTAVITDPRQYQDYCTMADCLLDPGRDLLEKQSRVAEYLLDLMQSLAEAPARGIPRPSGTLAAVAEHLDSHCTDEVSLDDPCRLSGYSPGHLVRAFRQSYGLTPHAYLINRRIQHGQSELKRGVSIADAALNAGFADQAHRHKQRDKPQSGPGDKHQPLRHRIARATAQAHQIDRPRRYRSHQADIGRIIDRLIASALCEPTEAPSVPGAL